VQNGFAESASLLRNAFAKNPYMKVMVAASYYDLATPYFAAQYTFNHMGLNPEMHKNIEVLAKKTPWRSTADGERLDRY
jgi:carboxypeptidase C (cathepsin A)